MLKYVRNKIKMSNSHQVSKKKCEEKESAASYSVMSSTSVASIAETVGFKNLNEEILDLISEDVSYKLRELLHCCSVHTRHVKQHALTTRTVDSVLQITSSPFVDGHRSNEPLEFIKVEDCDVFVENNPHLDLADLALSDNEKLFQPPDVDVYREVLYPDVIEENLGPVKSSNVSQPCFEVTFETAKNGQKSLEQKIRIVKDGIHIKKRSPKKVKSENGEIKPNKEIKIKEEESGGDRKPKKDKKNKDIVSNTLKKEEKGDKERKHKKEEQKSRKEPHRKDDTKITKDEERDQYRKDKKKSSKEDSHTKHKKDEKKNNVESSNTKRKKDDDKRINVEILSKHKKEEKKASVEVSELKQKKEDRTNKADDVFVKPRDVESKIRKHENSKKQKKEENINNYNPKKDNKHESKVEKEETVTNSEHLRIVKHQDKKSKQENDLEYNESAKLMENIKFPVMCNSIYPKIPSYLKTYYQRSCRGILMDSSVVFGVILRHLKSSPKIKVLAPFFLNFACTIFTTVRWGSYLSQKSVYIVDAIVSNKYVNVEGTAVIHRVVSMLLNAAVLSEDESNNDYEFRKLIGNVVGKVLNEWCREDEDIEVTVQTVIVCALSSDKHSALSYYGAINILLSLGSNALYYAFWPHFCTLRDLVLNNSWSSPEFMELENLILMVLHAFFRQSWESKTYEEPVQDLFRFASEHFGDRLTIVEAYGLLPCGTTSNTNQSTSSELSPSFDMNIIDRPRHISFLRELPILPVVSCDTKQDISNVFETVILKKKEPYKFKIKWINMINISTRGEKKEPVQSEQSGRDNNLKSAVHRLLVGQRRRHMYSKAWTKPRRHAIINYNPLSMLTCYIL